MRTRVRAPGQNGSRERGFGSLKYEKLFLEEIPDALDLVRHAEDYRIHGIRVEIIYTTPRTRPDTRDAGS